MRIRNFRITLVLLSALSAPVHAEDTPLTRLHALLEPLRDPASIHGGEPLGFMTYNHAREPLRFAYFAYTPARRLLRDWIEAELAHTPENVYHGALMLRLNSELSHADLFCEPTHHGGSPDRCDLEHANWNARGYVYPEISVDRVARGVLVVRAGLGIECGTDTSAYAYEWREGRWQRFWQDELPIQEGTPYWPRWIDSVSVSPVDAKSGTRLVMALANMDWCSSTHYPMYVRLWRVPAGGVTPKLLLDLDEMAWLGGDDPVIGQVSLHDARIEFTRSDFNTALLHFRVDGDAVTRVDPLALTAAGFIEEWLRMEWKQSHRWVASGVRDLSEWHAKLRGTPVSTDSAETHRCRDRRDLQVTLPRDFGGRRNEAYYFRVRKAGERFEMLDIGTGPQADCDGPAE
jgi:hypothetical protein